MQPESEPVPDEFLDDWPEKPKRKPKRGLQPRSHPVYLSLLTIFAVLVIILTIWVSALLRGQAVPSSVLTVTVAQINTPPNSISSATKILPPQMGSGHLAFASIQDGHQELFTLNLDGSLLTKITRNETINTPDWSPDGKQILYRSGDGGKYGVYLINADGTHRQRLTDTTQTAFSPVWSPDGKHIAYVYGPDDAYEIYLMNADGSNPQRITTGHAVDGLTSRLTWSPDGDHIAFASGRNGNSEIYVTSIHDPTLINLTNHPSNDLDPAWSPDGNSIAFASDRTHNYRIYTMKTDGSDVTLISDGPDDDVYPAWSPDGQRLIFESKRDGTWQLYLNDKRVSAPIQITQRGGIQAAWSH